MSANLVRLAPRAAAALALALGLLAAPAARAVDLSGCWSGEWGSYCTGHHGPLNATFVKQDENHYCVRFSGRFFKIVPFKYTTVLTVISDDGTTVQLSGDSYLGRMMGNFHYDAAATDCAFNSNYSSCKDNGYFKLCRCSRFESCQPACQATCQAEPGKEAPPQPAPDAAAK